MKKILVSRCLYGDESAQCDVGDVSEKDLRFFEMEGIGG